MSRFDDVLSSINPDASPGYPWGLICTTKGELIEKEKDVLYEQVVSRLQRYVEEYNNPTGDSLIKAQEFVLKKLADPVRIFVKDEPHSLEKIETGRLRLVSSVSIVDEIIERLLCSEQNEREIENWENCPSKPGMGLSTDPQQVAVYNYVKPWLTGAKVSDISGWDWSFKGWCFDFDYLCRIKLCQPNARHEDPDSNYSLWMKLLHTRFEALKWTMFVTSHGKMFIQTKPGIMLSGSYLTASTNSRARIGVAHLLGATNAMAMGDDCLELTVLSAQGMIQSYSEYGFKVTDVDECEHTFEFCSHRFFPNYAKPLNLWKGLFRLVSKAPSTSEYLQFLAEYRHCSHIELNMIISFLLTLPDWCRVILAINGKEEQQ